MNKAIKAPVILPPVVGNEQRWKMQPKSAKNEQLIIKTTVISQN